MITPIAAFSGFSVKDLEVAKEFYSKTLGLETTQDARGLGLKLPNGGQVFIYPKDSHEPASFTVLNFVVSEIDSAVDDLVLNGVKMETYDNMPAKQDSKGILRGMAAHQGPDIAWFKDPSGNILAVLQDK